MINESLNDLTDTYLRLQELMAKIPPLVHPEAARLSKVYDEIVGCMEPFVQFYIRQHEAQQPSEDVVDRVARAIGNFCGDGELLIEHHCGDFAVVDLEKIAKAAIAAMNMGDASNRKTEVVEEADKPQSANRISGKSDQSSPAKLPHTLIGKSTELTLKQIRIPDGYALVRLDCFQGRQPGEEVAKIADAEGKLHDIFIMRQATIDSSSEITVNGMSALDIIKMQRMFETCSGEANYPKWWQAVFDAGVKQATDAMTRELNALPKLEYGWQPIETAPINESVLVFIPNAEHYGQGVYRGLQVDMGTGRHWQISGLHMGRDCPHDQQPTHWMPLPDTTKIEGQ